MSETREITFEDACRALEEHPALKSLCYDLDCMPEQLGHGSLQLIELIAAAFLCGRESAGKECAEIADEVSHRDQGMLPVECAIERSIGANEVAAAIRERFEEAK